MSPFEVRAISSLPKKGGRVQEMLLEPSSSARRVVSCVSAVATVAFLAVPRVEQMRCGVPGLVVAYAAPCSP